MAVLRPIWRTVWPPKVIPENDDEERIGRLQRKPRSKWTGEDWRAWAEFLEASGSRLANELNEIRLLAADLAAKVPPPIKPGPKPKPKPMTIAAGRLGLVRVPVPRKDGQKGRPTNSDASEKLRARLLMVEKRMDEGGSSREAACRALLKTENPRWRTSRIEDEARLLSRKLSRVKAAR